MIETWIIPCNTKFFDIANHFISSDEVVWRNYFTIKTGDLVYIYIGGTVRQLKYRCTVLEDKVSDDVVAQNSYTVPEKKVNNYFSKKEKYMRIKLDFTFPNGVLTYDELKSVGLGQVQLQARPGRKVAQYINQKAEKLINQSNGGDE